jgi:hypothetical protein
MGQWYDYTLLIAALNRDEFTLSSIEEATDISGMEQNHLMVVAQLYHLLLEELASNLVPYFNSYSGPKLLYELRFLIAR